MLLHPSDQHQHDPMPQKLEQKDQHLHGQLDLEPLTTLNFLPKVQSLTNFNFFYENKFFNLLNLNFHSEMFSVKKSIWSLSATLISDKRQACNFHSHVTVLTCRWHLTDCSASHAKLSGILDSKSTRFLIFNHIWNKSICQDCQESHQNYSWMFYHFIKF